MFNWPSMVTSHSRSQYELKRTILDKNKAKEQPIRYTYLYQKEAKLNKKILYIVSKIRHLDNHVFKMHLHSPLE